MKLKNKTFLVFYLYWKKYVQAYDWKLVFNEVNFKGSMQIAISYIIVFLETYNWIYKLEIALKNPPQNY